MWDFPLTSPMVTGTVNYGNAIGAPSPRIVSNVLLSGAGAVPVSATTGGLGTYALTGFGAGSYTVTPTKTGSVNGWVTSFDAAKVAQHAAGGSQLTGNQLVVADVSGNGTVTSFDAGQIARYVAALSGSGATGNWIFSPVNRTYASVTTGISGEDFSALLMGEVSGNWVDSGARPVGSRQLAIGSKNDDDVGRDVRVPADSGGQLAVAFGSQAADEKNIVVPVNIQGAADKGIISYEFDLRYDPSVIQPQVEAVDVKRTVSRGLVVVTNAIEPGLLRVVAYGPMAIDADGVLLNLRFVAVGYAGFVSPLAFERMVFNEGNSRVMVTGGRVEISY